jgi:photosystem II stability/assembly factor-like uncharacterized protein
VRPAPLPSARRHEGDASSRKVGTKMSGRSFTVLLAVLALARLAGADAANAGMGFWTSWGPGDGSVHSIAADPSTSGTVYAGETATGVYKSVDGGATWQWSGVGMGWRQVQALAVDPIRPATLYAVANAPFCALCGLPNLEASGDVFRSTDGGAHWRAVLHFNRVLLDMAASPGSPSAIYVAHQDAVFASFDGGERWAPIYRALSSGISALAADPNRIGGVFVLDGDKLFQTTDRGRHWRLRLIARSAGGRLFQSPSDPATLYLQDSNGVTYRTANGGRTWVANPHTENLLAVDPHSPTTVYGESGYQDFQISHDGGRSWAPALNRGYPVAEARALAFDLKVPGRFYVGLDELGVITSVNSGRRWSASAERFFFGLPAQMLKFDPRRPSTVYVQLWGNVPGLQVSADGGATWAVDAILPSSAIKTLDLAFDPTSPSVVYAAEDTELLRSLDGGTTWRPTPQQPPSGAGTLAFASGGALLAGGCGISRSSDGGNTWSTSLGCVVPTDSVVRFVVDPQDPELVYAESVQLDRNDQLIGYRILRSSDGGLTWSPFVAGGKAVALDPLQPTTLYAAVAGELRKSLDGGGSWQAILEVGFITAVVVDPVDPSQVFAGTLSQGVLRSVDGGATWRRVNAGLAEMGRPAIRDLVADPARPHTVYALFYDGGIFTADFSASGSSSP